MPNERRHGECANCGKTAELRFWNENIRYLYVDSSDCAFGFRNYGNWVCGGCYAEKLQKLYSKTEEE